MPILFPWKFRQNREELLNSKEHLCYPSIVNASFTPVLSGLSSVPIFIPELPASLFVSTSNLRIEYRPLHHGE
jgi:hypothetical protein